MVGDLTERLRETGLESAPPLWIEGIQVQTNTPIDLDSRRNSADFLGEVLGLIESSRRNPAGLKEMISELYHDRRVRRFLEIPGEEELVENSRRNPTRLQEMIGELYHDRRVGRFLEIPAEEELVEILAEVESMCLDELVAEETE